MTMILGSGHWWLHGIPDANGKWHLTAFAGRDCQPLPRNWEAAHITHSDTDRRQAERRRWVGRIGKIGRKFAFNTC